MSGRFVWIALAIECAGCGITILQSAPKGSICVTAMQPVLQNELTSPGDVGSPLDGIETQDHERFLAFETDLIESICERPTARRPMFIFVAGLPATGKTLFILRWCERLRVCPRLTIEPSAAPRIRILDHRDVALGARKRSRIKHELGRMPRSEYDAIGRAMARVRELAFAHLSGPLIAFDEAPLVTQTFGRRLIGVSRGNLAHVRRLFAGSDARLVILMLDETERRRRIIERPLPQDQGFLPGSWTDLNKQLAWTVADVFYRLMRDGLAPQLKPGLKSPVTLRRMLEYDPSLFFEVLHNYLVPRLIMGVAAEDALNRVLVLHRSPYSLAPKISESDLERYRDQYSLISALWQEAASTGDASLAGELRLLGLYSPPPLDLRRAPA